MAAVIVELNESAHALADIIYDDVHRHLSATASQSEYTVSQYNEDLEHHLKAITFTIPPIEIGDNIYSQNPCNLVSILNVGWAAVLTQVDKIRVRRDPERPHTGALAAIHNLLLKAVELSEAKRRWEAAR